SAFPDLSHADREERLRPLWGLKIGRDDSKEARSLEWVMSYLSDFNGQLQARDLVRFLAAAAKRSPNDAKRPDNRVLAPAAMRNAIDDCSNERVKEVKDENLALKDVLDRLSQNPPEARFNPLGLEDLANLGLVKSDIDLMALNGAIFLSNGEYYIPEILRVGLGFTYAGGARKKVVGLMREAAARNKAGF
ncbi:MAG: ParA family protein, partial [Alphaproteobacteria bacterium]|nr:ParA family protein [Alphaproteobacteria bacterium]